MIRIVHPRNKRVAGERMALWALAKQYDKNVAYSGPLFKSMKVSGGTKKWKSG